MRVNVYQIGLAVILVLGLSVPPAFCGNPKPLEFDVNAYWRKYIAKRTCPIVINEVMVNARGPIRNERINEYIELYNSSIDRSVDIEDWTIRDGSGDTDELRDFTGVHDVGMEGFTIPPRGLAIIVDRDYEGEYNNYIREYAGNNFIMVTVNDSNIGDLLQNSGDSITITTDWREPLRWMRIRIGGIPIREYQILSLSWSGDDGLGSTAYDGVSWERNRYFPRVWFHSPDPNGSTPCVRNSFISKSKSKKLLLSQEVSLKRGKK